MGLTISYNLNLSSVTVQQVRSKMQALHDIAQKLDFISIGDLVELEGDACQIDPTPPNDPHLLLKIQGGKLSFNGSKDFPFQPAAHLIGFNAIPGEGCAMATFGLAIPEQCEADWSWFSYCKTQYSSNPEYGGLENFLTCHLKMVHTIDAIAKLGIGCEVIDNGGYWESRDLEVLSKAIGQNNLFMAAVMGGLKDRLEDKIGGILQAPIIQYPNFEHLEAEGQSHLKP
ncbi:MAG: hypothetical protein HC852_13440 [Acaryochloridaceae cyanobacterium RU_4_10]|nr:hypothetical protein [Acaryochloridaceae cyanobacterium RU_4_10]